MKTLNCDNCNTTFNVNDHCLVVVCPGCHCEVEARSGAPPNSGSEGFTPRIAADPFAHNPRRMPQ